ncbi:MAG: hypothetical protein ABI690_07840 [Chloroflexota bacterium]
MPDSALFPYSQVRNALGETAWRPILPLRLTHEQRTLQVAGLIETGADVNVMPYRIGLELGAVWEEQGRQVEVSGKFSNYEAREIVLSAHIAPFDLEVRLAFAWTRAVYVPLLLGQVNFLKLFKVCYLGFQNEFELHLRSDS